MKKKLIKGLIFALAGILLFIATTKITGLNNFINNYWFIVIGGGVGLFIYSSRLKETIQQMGHTMGGILLFRGLVAAPFTDELITKYPYTTIMFSILLFYFHEPIFSVLRLAES